MVYIWQMRNMQHIRCHASPRRASLGLNFPRGDDITVGDHTGPNERQCPRAGQHDQAGRIMAGQVRNQSVSEPHPGNRCRVSWRAQAACCCRRSTSALNSHESGSMGDAKALPPASRMARSYTAHKE